MQRRPQQSARRRPANAGRAGYAQHDQDVLGGCIDGSENETSKTRDEEEAAGFPHLQPIPLKVNGPLREKGQGTKRKGLSKRSHNDRPVL